MVGGNACLWARSGQSAIDFFLGWILPPPAPPTADEELDSTVETGSDAPIGAIVGGVAAAVAAEGGRRALSRGPPPAAVGSCSSWARRSMPATNRFCRYSRVEKAKPKDNWPFF